MRCTYVTAPELTLVWVYEHLFTLNFTDSEDSSSSTILRVQYKA